MYQRLVKSRSFNLSDTDPEPLLTVQIPGCALRPINIPVITTTASTLIKISRFSVKHRYIPSYRIYTRPLSFLSSQGGICYCYFITTASEYYYEGNRIYNVKFAIGIALMLKHSIKNRDFGRLHAPGPTLLFLFRLGETSTGKRLPSLKYMAGRPSIISLTRMGINEGTWCRNSNVI